MFLIFNYGYINFWIPITIFFTVINLAYLANQIERYDLNIPLNNNENNVLF